MLEKIKAYHVELLVQEEKIDIDLNLTMYFFILAQQPELGWQYSLQKSRAIFMVQEMIQTMFSMDISSFSAWVDQSGE